MNINVSKAHMLLEDLRRCLLHVSQENGDLKERLESAEVKLQALGYNRVDIKRGETIKFTWEKFDEARQLEVT